jgi:hypothetical protein
MRNDKGANQDILILHLEHLNFPKDALVHKLLLGNTLSKLQFRVTGSMSFGDLDPNLENGN